VRVEPVLSGKHGFGGCVETELVGRAGSLCSLGRTGWVCGVNRGRIEHSGVRILSPVRAGCFLWVDMLGGRSTSKRPGGPSKEAVQAMEENMSQDLKARVLVDVQGKLSC
jgi:hypothetical protein